MLKIYGKSQGRGFCDGLSRRDFLSVGGMMLGGLSLPQLLRAESNSRVGHSHKAIINVFLPGGPPHLDMWDMKPTAPREVRGEFLPIKTNVPGIEICEMFPRMAAMMDKFAIIRSLVGSDGDHAAYHCMTGHRQRGAQPSGGWPAMGAWAAKLAGQPNPAIPAHLSLMYKTQHREWGEPEAGGFLGQAYAPFQLVGKDAKTNRDENMVLQGITLDRLQDRRRLLGALDHFRRDADNARLMTGMDTFMDEAMGILTSSALADAMDLSKEDPKILERYGENDPTFQLDGAPRMIRNLCVARRLVEAGARLVSLNFSRWDWHGGNDGVFIKGRIDMPMLDQGLAALVTDLHERGLQHDVSVVVWGEFGRTPKVNSNGGRDHWPEVNAAVLAGGGMRTGQVIGATNRLGERAADRPVTFEEIFATLYHNLGLDLNFREFDVSGRPQYLVDSGARPIGELI